MRDLTEDEVLSVIQSSASLQGRIKLTYESGPYDIDRPTNVAMIFAAAIQKKFREVNSPSPSVSDGGDKGTDGVKACVPTPCGNCGGLGEHRPGCLIAEEEAAAGVQASRPDLSPVFKAFMTAAQEIIDHNHRELVSDWLTRAWHHKVLPKLSADGVPTVEAPSQALTVAELARRSGVKALHVMQRIKEWGGGDVTLNQPINLIGLATAALAHGAMVDGEPNA